MHREVLNYLHVQFTAFSVCVYVRVCKREIGLVKQCTVVNLIFVKQNILLPWREVMSLQGFWNKVQN